MYSPSSALEQPELVQSVSFLGPQIFLHKLRELDQIKNEGHFKSELQWYTLKLFLSPQVIEVGVTNHIFRIACSSNLKRAPYGSEEDFSIAPAAKLTRLEEPKRGASACSPGGAVREKGIPHLPKA